MTARRMANPDSNSCDENNIANLIRIIFYCNNAA